MYMLDQLACAGVGVWDIGNGRLRAMGNLTDATCALIETNKSAILEELAASGRAIDVGVVRRRERALVILAERPERRIAVVAETGDPTRVAVAVRGGAVGELEIPADRFDPLVLLGLLEESGEATLH